MTSGSSRKLRVGTTREGAAKAIRKLWAGLPYGQKQLKKDDLPRDFWGTFLVKGPGVPIKRFNKVNFFAEVRPGDNDTVIIRIEAVIADPFFGQGAFDIVARCILLLVGYFRRRDCEVRTVWQLFGPNIVLK